MPQEYTDILVEQQRRWRKTLALTAGIVTLVIGFSFYTGLFDPQRLSEGIPSVISLMAEGSPPDFSTAGTWLKPLFDTLAMSIAGTAIAVFFSVPLGLLAARNTTPHPIVYQMARTILNGLRSVPELIMGILFVAAVGFGALPGVLALGLHSIGMVGKFISEAIEHVADEQIGRAHV